MDAENRVFTAWNDSENHGESPPVKLVTKVVQDKLPKEFRIRWYAHDIDDPAKHVHIDPNDKFPKEPRLPGEVDGYLPPAVGGFWAHWRDNSGRFYVPHMFAEEWGFAISEQRDPKNEETVGEAIGGKDRPVQRYMWREGEAKTSLDNARVSKVIFYATDDRGDNFVIHTGFDYDGFSFLSQLQQDTTAGQKPITVWTKQKAMVYAMNRPTAPAGIIVIKPGPDGVIDPGYDARDRIEGGIIDARPDARVAHIVQGDGETQLFSRRRGNDRLIGRIEPINAADGLSQKTVVAIKADDILRGEIIEGADNKLEKATVTSGGGRDDHSLLKITKAGGGAPATPKHANDALDGDGNIVAGPDKQLDSAPNLAAGDVIRGKILEGADGILDSRPVSDKDVVIGTIERGNNGVLDSLPDPDTDVGRKDRVVGYIDGGNPRGAKTGNPNNTCLDIAPGYLNNLRAGDDRYAWSAGSYWPVITAGPDRIRDTKPQGDDELTPGPDPNTFYPFDLGEADAKRFDYFKRTYAQSANSECAGYLELEVEDATTRASYASDFGLGHYQDAAGNGYVLADGQTLTLKVDGGAEQTIKFSKGADFMDITDAKTAEIVVVINAKVRGLARELKYNCRGVGSHVCLRANTSIEITGGTALPALGFAVEAVTRNHTRHLPDISDGAGRRVGELKGNLEYEMYFRAQSDVHKSDDDNPANPMDTVSIYGVRSTDGNVTDGATDRKPHSLINVGLLETRGVIHDDASCREPGHSWTRPGVGDSLLPIPAVWRPDKPQEDNPFHGTQRTAQGVVWPPSTAKRW